jgi:hypothetical protein
MTPEARPEGAGRGPEPARASREPEPARASREPEPGQAGREPGPEKAWAGRGQIALMVASAQLIRTAEVSGWSPNSPAR